MESNNINVEMGQEPIPSFKPEINERSRQIAENLRKNSILELYDLVSNGSDVCDLMSFQPTSVQTQKKMTRHQVLAIQYFIPYVMKHSYKLDVDEIPDSIEKTKELIKRSYYSTPVMVDFDERMHLFVTKDSFLGTMKIYLMSPNGKKFPIPIKFDKRGIPGNLNETKNDNLSKKNKERNLSSKLTKSHVGPQMEKAISNYLKKKQLINDKNNNKGNNGVCISELDPECTFQPHLRKTLYEKYRNELGVNSITKNDECMQMIKKYLLLDNNDKDEKVESYFKSLQECTFQPNIEKFIKRGVPKEYYLKIQKEKEEEIKEIESHNKLEMVFFGKEENENNMDNERIQREREKAINRIFREEWNNSMKTVFNCEQNKIYSNMIPITDEFDSSELMSEEMEEKDSIKNSRSFKNKSKGRIKYEWETREQGPIYDREFRQRLKEKKEPNSYKNTEKIQKKPKKKYIPPYKWEEDLRNESNMYDAKTNSELNNNKQNENDSQIFDKNKWERYIRLKNRHVKSIPVSNTNLVTNPEEGVDEGLTDIAKCYSRICEIATPITVVGIRENIINYLEKELERPLPNLIEMFDNDN
ncbi:uncharacterized protein cubi_00100 [Cryptosporidium ubiquitum]|uniref:Uncharacterized protein n=1 Tax=Cryptosporidium ubiquitum TaxID=857276 RepID=A0A1J4MM62_9CRYT|nr:uncharacterized protein cubi_00100 [Cryptosporidium ubiquitum]OII74547.1 hypothetical protein cubi_00100 [Cryptosporidium ubiquitum]